MLRVILNASALAFAVAATAMAAVAEAQSPSPGSTPASTPAGFVRPAAPGRLVDVGGGRRLHIYCKGPDSGAAGRGPTVIIEAGLSQYTSNSTNGAAQDAIVATAGVRVCTYDRAGMGWSDPAPAGWTLEAMTADLHRLLAASGEPGPYVLVGHSFGGLLVRDYARAYPAEAAGVVLVDATSDVDFAGFDAAAPVVISQIDQAVANARPGQPVIGLPAGSAPELILSFTPEVLLGVKAEFEAWGRLPAARKQPGGFGTLGDTPLIVIRRGKTAATPPNAEDEAHRQGQEALAALSTNSVLVVVQNSGHAIPLDEPQVVADAVRRVIERAAGRAGPNR